MNKPMICYCQGTYGERIEQTKEGIRRIRPYIDRAIIIVDETVTEEQKQELRNMDCEVYFHEWHDDFVEMRNHYLEKVQTDSWIIVADPDEYFNEAFCKDLRKIIKQAEDRGGIDRLLINSHDVTYQPEDVEEPKETISTFFKNLVFRNRSGSEYVGKGEGGRVHEGLDIPGAGKLAMKLDTKYWYTHVKYWHEIWERAARNVFIGGGGINIGGRNLAWKPLREVCKAIGKDNWIDLREYLRNGGIDAKLKVWLWKNRFEGWDYQHEMMEFGRWYFEYLHPEETAFTEEMQPLYYITIADNRVPDIGEEWKAVKEIPPDSPPGVMNYVDQTYQQVFGRHADQEGKEFYTQAILNGQIRREDLADILKQAPEFQQKLTQSTLQGTVESVRLNVPVNVDVRMSEDLFIQALMRSNTFWKTLKPKIDVGTFLEGMLGEGWTEFQQWFYETEPSLEQFIKKLEETKGGDDDL